MRGYVIALVLCLCGLGTAVAQQQLGRPATGPQSSAPRTEIIVGTVTDAADETIPGASVVLEGPGHTDRRTAVTKDDGAFEFRGLRPGVPYRVNVRATGFTNWTSPALVLRPDQYFILKGVRLQPAPITYAITVTPETQKKIATQQVEQLEQQRIVGIFPNFYTVFNRDAVPLTSKLKFRLALRTSYDPVTIAGVGAIAGIYQATDHPSYGQGAKGYAQRFGSVAADGFADIMIGGAILPSLLHQDPRYFYQGTGTKKSRFFHAVSSPFVCKGDNGRMQVNYSSMGGDLLTGALSNAYYPAADRGAGLVLSSFLIGTAERTIADLAQEFILGKLTSRPKKAAKTSPPPTRR